MYSSDGGNTWTAGSYATASNATSQTLNLGNGLTMDVSANALHAARHACSNHDDTQGT